MTKKKRVRPVPATPKPQERGQSAFARNDFDSAIKIWTDALRTRASVAVSSALTSALAEAHFRRACKNMRRAPAQALADLKAASGLLPADPIYQYYLGLAYHRLGDLANAVVAYRESLRNDPLHYDRSAYYLCLALAESGGDPAQDSAWELLSADQRSRLRPQNAALTAALGQLSQGDFAGAEVSLRQVHPEFPDFAHYYLGVIAWRQGKSVESLAHWLSALHAGFDTPALRHNLECAYVARCLEQLESPALLKVVQAGLKVIPESPLLLKLKQYAEFVEGNRAASTGNWSRALEYWQSAAKGAGARGAKDTKMQQIQKIQKGDPVGSPPRELLSNIALAYEHLEQWTEAAEMWRDVIRRRPRRGENTWSKEYVVQLWKHIDSLYARTGYFTQSVHVLRHAIKAKPDDLALRLALVWRHLDNQNWRSAKNAALDILELNPQHPEALYLYAQALDAEGDLDLMIEAWEKVAASGDARFGTMARQRLRRLYAERGDFYFSMDDVESGAADYVRALALAPNDPDLHLRYGAALTRHNPKLAREQFAYVDLADPDAALAVIGAWHRANDHAEAARWLKRTPNPDKPALLVELGAGLLEEAPRLANTYFERALDHLVPGEPDNPRLLTMMAVAAAETGALTKAQDYAARALRADPQFGPAHFNIGLWDAAKGRRQAALKSWRSALAWAKKTRRPDIAGGIEEAIQLLEERYVPTLADILDTIDPDGQDKEMRSLMGSFPKRGEGVPE